MLRSECAWHCWEIKARSGARKNLHSGRGGVFLDIPFCKTHRPVRRGFACSHLDCVSYQQGMSLLSTRTARCLEWLTACPSIGASGRQRQLRWPCPLHFQKDFTIDCGVCVLHLRTSQLCACWRPRRCREPSCSPSASKGSFPGKWSFNSVWTERYCRAGAPGNNCESKWAHELSALRSPSVRCEPNARALP